MTKELSWYDKYRASVKEQALKVKPVKEVDQAILHLKAIGTEAFELPEGGSYLKQDGKFYFTELLVNQLMQFAFNEGRKDIEEKSYNRGRCIAHKEIVESLGGSYDD